MPRVKRPWPLWRVHLFLALLLVLFGASAWGSVHDPSSSWPMRITGAVIFAFLTLACACGLWLAR